MVAAAPTFAFVSSELEIVVNKPRSKRLTVLESVGPLIQEVRGERVILDADLARIYGVPTKALNQAVKRNMNRFPPDFLFQLTPLEMGQVNRSQIVTGSQKHRDPRLRPRAFTEHGAIMAANLLNSSRAIETSVHVIRAFVTLRREARRYESLARKLAQMDRTQRIQGKDIKVILSALYQLEQTTNWAYPEGRRLIGFQHKADAKGNDRME